nr:LysE family transporter [Rhizobium bangladeshense]
MMLVIGRGVGQGRRTAFLSAVGITVLAGAIQISLLILGVGSLLHASLVAFDILRWAGAAYLAWLGVKLLRSADRHREGHGQRHSPSRQRGRLVRARLII